MTLFDPVGYQKLLADRKAKEAAALERERQRQEGAQPNKGLRVACAAFVAAAMLSILVVSSMCSGSGSRVGGVSVSSSTETSTADQTGIVEQAPSTSGDNSSSTDSKALHTLENAGAEDDYILPDSDSRYYRKAEFAMMSLEDLYYARNEIYARHGRGFKNADLQAYFNQKSWYERRYSPEQFDAMPSPLNDYEKKNADLMLEVEKARNSPYLAG